MILQIVDGLAAVGDVRPALVLVQMDHRLIVQHHFLDGVIGIVGGDGLAEVLFLLNLLVKIPNFLLPQQLVLLKLFF